MSEIIYIVAGNVHQFNDYVNKKTQEAIRNCTPYKKYVYVSHPDTLRGLSSIKGFFIGTWRDRNDIDEIREAISIIKTKMKMSNAMVFPNVRANRKQYNFNM